MYNLLRGAFLFFLNPASGESEIQNMGPEEGSMLNKEPPTAPQAWDRRSAAPVLARQAHILTLKQGWSREGMLRKAL